MATNPQTVKQQVNHPISGEEAEKKKKTPKTVRGILKEPLLKEFPQTTTTRKERWKWITLARHMWSLEKGPATSSWAVGPLLAQDSKVVITNVINDHTNLNKENLPSPRKILLPISNQKWHLPTVLAGR